MHGDRESSVANGQTLRATTGPVPNHPVCREQGGRGGHFAEHTAAMMTLMTLPILV